MFRAATCPSSGGQTIHTPQLVQLHMNLRLKNGRAMHQVVTLH